MSEEKSESKKAETKAPKTPKTEMLPPVMPNYELKIKILTNLAGFLDRVEMKGKEAFAYVECVTYLRGEVEAAMKAQKAVVAAQKAFENVKKANKPE